MRIPVYLLATLSVVGLSAKILAVTHSTYGLNGTTFLALIVRHSLTDHKITYGCHNESDRRKRLQFMSSFKLKPNK